MKRNKAIDKRMIKRKIAYLVSSDIYDHMRNRTFTLSQTVIKGLLREEKGTDRSNRRN